MFYTSHVSAVYCLVLLPPECRPFIHVDPPAKSVRAKNTRKRQELTARLLSAKGGNLEAPPPGSLLRPVLGSALFPGAWDWGFFPRPTRHHTPRASGWLRPAAPAAAPAPEARLDWHLRSGLRCPADRGRRLGTGRGLAGAARRGLSVREGFLEAAACAGAGGVYGPLGAGRGAATPGRLHAGGGPRAALMR